MRFTPMWWQTRSSNLYCAPRFCNQCLFLTSVQWLHIIQYIFCAIHFTYYLPSELKHCWRIYGRSDSHNIDGRRAIFISSYYLFKRYKEVDTSYGEVPRYHALSAEHKLHWELGTRLVPAWMERSTTTKETKKSHNMPSLTPQMVFFDNRQVLLYIPFDGTIISPVIGTLKSTTTLMPYVRAVVGDVQVATLYCDSLEGAEDATTLQVAISLDEVGQRKKSYGASDACFHRSRYASVCQLKGLNITINNSCCPDRAWSKPHAWYSLQSCAASLIMVPLAAGDFGKEDFLYVHQWRSVRR